MKYTKYFDDAGISFSLVVVGKQQTAMLKLRYGYQIFT